ncbi:MAG TPA: 2Fe-2S iron-sulfur cluster-binding protein [Anaerolineae bacterium]|nr:2Fe-2S iron-sulfur cluster-binding protein [Anaerolineae bacterium]
MADITRATVFRYNPSVDPKPYYETYEVPWTPFMSALEVLRYIQENIKPISFDYSCRVTACGVCGLMVNGKPVLGCVTVVPIGEDILIEPLAGFRVIKDLTVDKTEVENRLYGTMPWFSRTKPMTEPLAMAPEAYVRTGALQECKSCLCCQAVCPVLTQGSPFYKGFKEFAGPYVLINIAMRYFDPREDFADERLKTAVREGLFECILCGQCYEVCTSGKQKENPEHPDTWYNHVTIFQEMMDAAKAKGWGP